MRTRPGLPGRDEAHRLFFGRERRGEGIRGVVAQVRRCFFFSIFFRQESASRGLHQHLPRNQSHLGLHPTHHHLHLLQRPPDHPPGLGANGTGPTANLLRTRHLHGRESQKPPRCRSLPRRILDRFTHPRRIASPSHERIAEAFEGQLARLPPRELHRSSHVREQRGRDGLGQIRRCLRHGAFGGARGNVPNRFGEEHER
mmetsp:Transcript_7281/g.15215  ORF Transcript_7281/g.15215 Transcript_7281/m.15215 type:complete len:200 (+) Transcript_7281:254-853(+)